MKEKLKNIVEKQDSFAGKLFSRVFLFLILLSLLMVALETEPDLKSYRSVFHLIETVIIILFTVEYCLRIYVADRPLRFIFSWTGFIDFVAIAPFIFTHGLVDLSSVRIFWLLRVLRGLKLFRYTKVIHRFYRAFYTIKNEVIVFTIVTFFVVYLASVGIYYFEHTVQPDKFPSIFQSFWWAFVTLTTVGYGDAYPVTAGGKIFTVFILVIGLAVISVPSALMAAALIKTERD